MSNPAQKLKGDDLIDRLNKLPFDESRHFAIRRIHMEAKSLTKSDAAMGYMIMGMIEAEFGNEVESRHYFNTSIANSSRLIIQRNYAAALLKLGYCNEASEMTLRNVTFDPANPEVIWEVVNACLHAGRIHDALAYAKTLKDMALYPELVAQVRVMASLPESTLVNLPAISDSVAKVLRKHNVTKTYRHLQLVGESQYVLRYIVDHPPQKVADINFDLADALSEMDPELGGHLLFICDSSH